MQPLATRFRDYLLTRSTLHITRSTGPATRFRPWWRKYWMVTSLAGERDKVGHHLVFGIRTLPHASHQQSKVKTPDAWMSAACGKVITALCVAIDNQSQRDPRDTQLCWIMPGGSEAFSGPMSCFDDALRFFPDYGTAATHPQQTIEGINP